MGINVCAITVIVPVFNTEESIFSECMKSIINQTFSDFEVIVVDDGSDKKYVDGIRRVIEIDERITLIRQEHSGVSAARNLALSLSNGEYVAFVDSDDILKPYFMKESYSFAKKYNADLVIGAVFRTTDLNMIMVHDCNPRIKIYANSQVENVTPYLLGHKYDMGLGNNGGINRGTVAKLFKRDIAVQVKFPQDMKICEDSLWILMVLNKLSKVCIVSQVWYMYRRNPVSATCSYNPNIISPLEVYFYRCLDYIDISKDFVYFGYVERIYELLRAFVYQSFIGNKDFDLSRKDRNKIIEYLYTTEPWIQIKNKHYIELSKKREKIGALLYKYKLLFLYWDLKGIIPNIYK